MSTLCFVFPGQGSQSLGMLGDLAEHYSEIQAVFEQASNVLGYDVWALTQTGPEEQLNQTEFTQPALLAAGYALWTVVETYSNIKPSFLAGHSLGEYTALVASGAMSFADGLRCVAARGQAMQSAVAPGEGAMAAIIGLDDIAVIRVCEQTKGRVTPANLNSPGQVVIAGETDAVHQAMELAKEVGAKLAKQIPVSVPSHCALMQPAADKMKDLLATIKFKTPSIPVIHNVDVLSHEKCEAIRDALVLQLTQPVRWVESIQWIQQQGVAHFVECGPGRVLSGLIKRIDRQLQLTSLSDKAALDEFINRSDVACH